MSILKSATSIAKSKKAIFSIIVVVLLFFVFLLAVYISDPNKGEPSALEIAKQNAAATDKSFDINPSGNVDNETNWRERSAADMQQNAADLANTKAQLDQLKAELELQKQNQSLSTNVVQQAKPEPEPTLPPPTNNKSNFNPTLPPPPSQTALGGQALAQQAEYLNGQSGFAPSGSPDAGVARTGRIKKLSAKSSQGLETTTSEGGDSTEVKKTVRNVKTYVPAGAFGRITLLSGVDAPTGGLADSNPMPVLMKVRDKGTLANYFKTDLKECTVIGAAKGNLSSERVEIRLETITCILANGTVIEEPIKGYVAGEDGKAGFRGKVISKQGSIIAKAAMAGVAGGMGRAVQDQYQTVSSSALGTVTSIDPSKVFQSGAAQGFGNAMDKIAEFYISRANETYPIVELASARQGDLVLTQGVDFKIPHINLKRGN
ncbi:TraB/VirB10 family protein [Acinetobacter baumannii]|uniref:TraB/VirB10 family protein n=1 Tax=Acinetobacter baumannii TaxID=470 RepID=UPI0034CFEEB9